MIYEMRIYDAMPGKMQDLNNRFQNITMDYFYKYNLQPVGFWTEDIGVNNRLIYILAFENMSQREKAWDDFRNDKNRAVAFAETEANGPLVAKISSRILKPTVYSQMK